MPRTAPAHDDRLPHGPFTMAEALSLGVSPEHLRTSSYDVPFHGVRMAAGSSNDLMSRCRALATTLDEGVAISHTTALRVLGVEVPWRRATDDRIHVVTMREMDRPQRDGVVAHRSRQPFLETVEIEGLRVTSPAQTFVHVAVGLRVPDDVVVLGDAMMRRKRMLVTPTELIQLAERTKKVKGIVQVRDQIGRTCAGTDSSMETRARLLLTSAGLPCPQVNEVVHAPDGTYVKRVDMLYPQFKIAIEYDGDQHRTNRDQWRDDVVRRRRLEALGWTIIVIVADDVTRDAARFVSDVRAHIRRAQEAR